MASSIITHPFDPKYPQYGISFLIQMIYSCITIKGCMKNTIIILLTFIFGSTVSFAGITKIELKKGSLLVYAVKEGNKTFTYTVTVQQWEGDNIIFAWQTNEKPQPRKGIITLHKYYSNNFPERYSLGSDEFLIGIGKGGDEKLTESQTKLIAPSDLNDYLLQDEDEVTFTANENGKSAIITSDDDEIELYSDKELTYNSKAIIANYAKIVSKKTKIEMGLIQEGNNEKHFLAFYKSGTLTMDLISIKTPMASTSKENATSNLSAPDSPQTKAQPLKMPPTKLAAVTKAYPLLSTLENYDVTNGGKDPKPFSETYDFRIGSGSPNPPSAVDCFTADLQILFKQKKNYNLADMTENVSKYILTSSAAEKLMGVYLKREASSIPGYKPWTHWKFVRSLNAMQLSKLAVELQGYIKQYGFTE
jgi:hypothetical protein